MGKFLEIIKTQLISHFHQNSLLQQNFTSLIFRVNFQAGQLHVCGFSGKVTVAAEVLLNPESDELKCDLFWRVILPCWNYFIFVEWLNEPPELAETFSYRFHRTPAAIGLLT